MSWSNQNGRYTSEYGQNINRWYSSESKWDKEHNKDKYNYAKSAWDERKEYTKAEYYPTDRYGRDSGAYGEKHCGCNKCHSHNCQCHQQEYYNSNRIIAMQLQLESTEAIQVDKQKNILFDKIIAQSQRGIEYDLDSGKIFLYEKGIYYVEWWIATDGIMGGQDTFVEFAIVTSKGKKIRADNPNTFGQISGMAILDIMPNRCQPVIIELKNMTDGTIGFGNVRIKAGIGIFRIEE